MTFRTLLMATSALAAANLFTAEAQAGEGGCQCWYVSIFGGANWGEDKSYSIESVRTFPSSNFSGTYESANYESDTGFVVGAAIGAGLDHWIHGLRGEVEASYRRNKVDGAYVVDFTFNSALVGSNTGPLNGYVSSFAIMANAWYDINTGGSFVPYFGGGIGWARTRYDINVYNSTFSSPLLAVDDSESGFAYQVGAGFNLHVSEQTAIGLGYRFFDAGEVKFDALNGTVELDQQNHAVMLNLNISMK